MSCTSFGALVLPSEHEERDVVGLRAVRVGDWLPAAQRIEHENARGSQVRKRAGDSFGSQHDCFRQRAAHVLQLLRRRFLAGRERDRYGNEAAEHAGPERGEEVRVLIELENDFVLWLKAGVAQAGENPARFVEQARV